MNNRVGKYAVVSLTLAQLAWNPSLALAGSKYPTAAELEGIRSTCSAGTVQKIEGNLGAAVRALKLSPAGQVSFHYESRDVAAFLEKMRTSRDNELYTAYLGCVQNLTLAFMEHSSKS